jgi:CHAT domain-containing protein/tetratricopeptide (TPR) repeat protein
LLAPRSLTMMDQGCLKREVRVRRYLTSLLAIVLIVGMGCASRAQQPQGEFAALYQRWQETHDPEQNIPLGEELLSREAALPTWPLTIARDQFKAEIAFGLGSAYVGRQQGVRADNIEVAIAHFEAALRIWTVETNPQDWARAHNNAGIAYWGRIRGMRADNQERAIAHLETALKVFTRETAPQEWAQLHNNIAIILSSRVYGDRDSNTEAAIAHFEAALTVFTRETAPLLWAMAQNNLGSVYRSRARGERADNREKALRHLEAALTVFTRETVPSEWASARYNLAMIYLSRIRGTPSDNQEAALEHLEAALTVFTRDAFPQQWAKAQSAVGDAYADRIRGLSAGNRQLAIAAYEAALTVFTPDAFPRDHVSTGRLLGQTLLQAGNWHDAALVHASARDAFLTLFGQGLEDVEARALIADAGPLFADAAYSALLRGETEAALALADEGRARLLAVAMRLQALDLPDAERRRVDELRVAIRAAQQNAESLQGTERTKAIETLARFRRELLDLVKTADGGDRRGAALAEARRVAEAGGAIVMPIVTQHGGKLIVLTKAARGSDLTVVDMPELTPIRLSELLVGPPGNLPAGWIAAYFINYLQGEEQTKRWPEWLAAIDRLGPALWRIVGARLDATLRERGIKRRAPLIWVPSGWLSVLPLGLAQHPFTKRRLADEYEITIAPSLEAYAVARRHADAAGPATLAAIINPTGDLPGADKEGEVVASYFAPETRLLLPGEKATPDAVLTALKSQTHWHFASHGTFSWTDVHQSALIMHGPTRLSVGKLMATEGLGRPRLVVLSACETGLIEITSNPDEFVGLPSAFMALGAAGVIGTLWPVNDTATALLMARFYELHIGERLSPATALSRAQAWLRQATNADLVAYTENAVVNARLAPRLAAEITQELGTEALRRSRNSTAVEWIPSERTPRSGTRAPDAAAASARPFAHPYFWAGFVHTGS